MTDHYDVHPPAPRWTHVALRVADIEATIAWYTAHTPLAVLHRRSDDMGHGAWLGHADQGEHPFVLVVAEFFPETDPYRDAPVSVLRSFAHVGIELTSRDAVDAAAARAEADGTLALPPTQLPPPVGYICMVRDPDGNTIEFSYDQGVYGLLKSAGGDAT